MPAHDVVASPAVVLVLAALAVTVCYALGCAVFPFTNCRGCGGNGRRQSPAGRAFRSCHRCQGTGRRLRVGRVIWDRLHQDDRHGRGGRF